jgi:hypothetical protein
MTAKIIQVRNGEATYKCGVGHIISEEIENPFDPAGPDTEKDCSRCETDGMQLCTRNHRRL